MFRILKPSLLSQSVSKLSYHTSAACLSLLPPVRKPWPGKKNLQQKREDYQKCRNVAILENEKAKTAGFAKDWEIKTAIVVQRPEIILPYPPEWELRYKLWKRKWIRPHHDLIADPHFIQDILKEQRDSGFIDQKRVDAILGGEMDRKRAERAKKETIIAAIASQFEESYVKRIGPRITAADNANDRKSLRRKLDRKLYLIVKRNREDHAWQFPQGLLSEGEFLRQAAERNFKTNCGTSINVYFTCNAPVIHYTYQYPNQVQKQRDTYGAKVFFYEAYYLKGNVVPSPTFSDFAWVTKDELAEYIQDSNLHSYVDSVLSDGGWANYRLTDHNLMPPHSGGNSMPSDDLISLMEQTALPKKYPTPMANWMKEHNFKYLNVLNAKQKHGLPVGGGLETGFFEKEEIEDRD